MELQINGRIEKLPDGISLSQLIGIRGIKQMETVAVELNGEILRREDFENIRLKEHDKLEILSLIGGG